ncbi:hypothetical protein [Nesterenkonia sp. PF2B19]|uniref:hypothetical protein n=1 Tax=Nesterenkonia sp. PF2B19 TaxID=1881858 RepID=UPI000872F780|nr:hypothetical protein [Nesterenkonia sp. PF2B19]OSM42769.1 hypothetical protein BCY76_012530 [Nesterenkonia sp. PF2B19]
MITWRSAAYPAAFVSAIGALWALVSLLTELGATWGGFAGAIGWVPVLITAPTVVAAAAGAASSLLLTPALRAAAPGVAATVAALVSATAAGLLAWWLIGERLLPAAHVAVALAVFAGVTLAWSTRAVQPPRLEAALARAVVVSLKVTIVLAALAAVVGLLAGPALEMTRLQAAWMVPWLVASLSFPLVTVGAGVYALAAGRRHVGRTS